MRRAGHGLAWAASVGTLLSVALSAGGAPPATKPLPRDPAAAEALFEQGRSALEKNDLVGTAGVITGVVTGLLLDGKRDDVDANCAPEGCNPRGLDAASDGKALLVVNAAAWGAGIAGLGAGAYLVLSSPRASHSTVDTARARRSPSLGVSVSPSGFGLAYRSRF